MPPKAQKPKAPVGYKAASLAKDILPASVKNPPRDGRNIRVPDATAIAANASLAQSLTAPIFQEFPKMEEWPGDEAAKAFDFALESTNLFVDAACTPFQLTPSLSSDSKSNLIFWRRPQEFIQAEQEEVTQLQNKYQLKRRTSQIISTSNGSPVVSSIRKEEIANSPLKHQIGAVEEPKISVKVFVHFERDETPQEMEQRKKEQAEKAEKEKKGSKKPGKKEEPVEEKPVFVKDIRLSNVDLSYHYPTDSKWIASQLQLIKDRQIRDCYTNKPIWTKIYPQQDGIPVTNKSGRYWVKLYYLGKERKIEIDDRMPVNFKGQCKFPRSVKKEEIWTCLFSKAIYKLIQLSSDITHLKNLCGSGFVMYSLTGMMSATIPMQIHSNDESSWNETLTFLKDTLSDQHYTDQDIILTCYSDPSHAQSQRIPQQQHSMTAHKKESLGSLHEDQRGEDNSPSQREHPVEDEFVNTPVRGQQTQKQNNQSDHNITGDASNSHQQQHYDENSGEGLHSGDQTPNQSSFTQKKRTLSTGGLARSATQIFETLQSRVKNDQISNIDEDEAEQSSFNTAQGQQQLQMSPPRRKIMSQMSKANAIIQQASKETPPSYVISGYSYPINECFFNEAFNMVYVLKRSDKEIKLRQEYIELSNIVITKMSKEEKIEHRRKKKELRDRIGDEEKKRIEMITRPPIQYKFFRLKCGAGRVPPVNIISPFTSDEIEIAKTCIVNKLNKPPNYQEGVEIRDDGKSVMSSVIKNGGADESLQMKPLDDFSMVSEFIEPMSRDQGGVWLQDTDLQNCFQHFQLFYNPTKYNHNKTINVAQAVDSEVTSGEDHEVLLIERNPEREAEERVMLLFGFTSKHAKNSKIVPEPYCILQKFDFGEFNAIHEYPPLRRNQSAQYTELDNSNQVFKLLVYTPVSFSLNISCDNPFKTMSVLNYLIDYEGYTVKNFNIEYQALEDKKYHVLFRMRIAPQEVESGFLLRVRSSTDNQMLRFMRLKLVEQDTESEGVMLGTIEGVNKNLYESAFTLSSYLRLSLRENTSYYLVLEGEPPYPVAEGALSVDFYSKGSELSVENLEHVEPLLYVEKYLPTKYGIIFREKIYVGEQTIASFHLKIMDVLGALAPVANAADAKKKAPAVKGGAAPNDQSEAQEKELEDKRLIKLELFENSKSIQYATGYNTSLLSNIVLKSTKSEEVSYLLEATFDLREWPDAKTLSAVTEKLHWFLKIISTDTVVVVRDTDKEDKEKGIKKSWEDAEPGRAEKSKKSRRKHQLLLKQQNGEKLTEEELAVIAEPRLSKKQREEAAAAATQPGGAKKAAKKDDKKPPAKNAKGGAKEEVVEEKKEVRPLPQSIQHRTNEIKAFLEHMEKERVSEYLAEHAGLIDIRSEENKAHLIAQADQAKEEVNSLLSTNTSLREELKNYQAEQLKTISSLIVEDRTSFKESWTQYLEQREAIKGRMSSKISKEKELGDVLRMEKVTLSIADFEKLINECAGIPDINAQLLVTAKKVVKNMRIGALADKFTEALAAFNVEALNAGMEDFTSYSVTGIDEELMQKVQDMINEAKDNPNYTADKLAELKKAGKKGKK